MPVVNETRKAEDMTAPAQEVVARIQDAPRPSMSWILRWVNYLFFIPAAALATVMFGTISLAIGVWDKAGRQQHTIARLWARVLLRIAMSPVAVEHPERIVVDQAAVYVSNHLSYYDTPVLYAKLPFQFRILAKIALWKIPFIGWYLKRSGQVPIDQSSTRAGVVSLGRGAKTLESGMPMVIFPEGGRAFNGELQKMVAGAAWMAIKAQVPLVPLTLVGTYELLPIHVYALRPRPLKMIVGEPISTVGMTTRDAEALTARLRGIIHETYVAEHVEE
jgi:1-acyl-sn-glycerol-3-phosphate acyltransferase